MWATRMRAKRGRGDIAEADFAADSDGADVGVRRDENLWSR